MSKQLNNDLESLCTKQFPTDFSDLPIKSFDDIDMNEFPYKDKVVPEFYKEILI